jgi:hypothetical protein
MTKEFKDGYTFGMTTIKNPNRFIDFTAIILSVLTLMYISFLFGIHYRQNTETTLGVFKNGNVEHRVYMVNDDVYEVTSNIKGKTNGNR